MRTNKNEQGSDRRKTGICAVAFLSATLWKCDLPVAL